MINLNQLSKFLGVESSRISHTEKLVSALGGFIGIFGVYTLTQYFLHGFDAMLIIASMGASAVLLFAVPHGQLSQPWALLGGHLVSSIIGVTVASNITNVPLAAGLAVGLAIGVMHYLRCIHPPGGATALVAVIAGPGVHELGYQFVLTPVMINALFIFMIAILFNYAFDWRRYPNSLMSSAKLEARKNAQDKERSINRSTFTEGDLRYAIKRMDLMLDVTHGDLIRLYALANRHSMGRIVEPEDITLAHYYSNGLYGKDWQIRQVIDESANAVIYKVVEGPDKGKNATMSKEEFSRWARFAVYQDGNEWLRKENLQPGKVKK